MAPPSLLYEALATLIFNFALTGVNAAAALLKPHLPGAAELDDIALVFALVMARQNTPRRVAGTPLRLLREDASRGVAPAGSS